ncbi:MAG: HD domain-containing phosphohydrolase, partial [Dehalococcoidia bacterium]
MTEASAPRDTEQSSIRMAELLGTFSVASSLGVGLPMEHGVRSCYIGMQLAGALELSPEETRDLYWTELLKDAGCTCWTSPIAMAILGDEITARKELFFGGDPKDPKHAFGWLLHYMAAGEPLTTRITRMADFFLHGNQFWKEGFHGACQVARRIAERLGMNEAVQAGLMSIFEQWDGKGMPNGTRGKAIPLVSRIVYLTSFLEVFHQMGGRDAAVRLAKARRGKAFDPQVVDAFTAVSSSERFWEGLEQESIWNTVLSLEPHPGPWLAGGDEVETVALALADFADLKSPYTVSHSRTVADAAVGIARRMRLPEDEIAVVRRGALVHDIGLVGVPSFVLNKPQASLTPAEWEQFRLHPYYSERVLSRVPTLGPVAAAVGQHHERMDGSGYYKGVPGASIPLGSRIIAVADAFCELTQGTAANEALEPSEALEAMAGTSRHSLYAEACQALADDWNGVSRRSREAGRAWPSGLTDREVEVLRLLCQGHTRKQIAASMVLSENTVRHHL